jgi:hypothetical protein
MSVLEKGRRAIERRMVDACTIRRADAGGTTDPDTGYPTQAYTELYAGKCRVQQSQTQAQQQDVGEDNLLLLRLEVQLPVAGTEGLAVGDEITMTAAVNDADLVGRVFLIHDLAHATEKTSRRVQCTERTG